MIDPDDSRTQKLDLPEQHGTAPKSNVVSISEPRLEDRAMEIGLVRERRPVFVYDESEAKKRGGSAERMAKMRVKQNEAGLRPAAVPIQLLDQVKAAGGWSEWQAQKLAEATAAVVPPAPVEIEKRVEVPGPERIVEVPGPERVVEKKVEVLVPAKLGKRDMASLSLGRALQELKGWKKRLAQFLLGIEIAVPAKEE